MDLSRYLGLFVSNAREHVAALEARAPGADGVADEQERRRLRQELHRHLHSLKGSAATMGIGPLAALAHAAEELLGRPAETAPLDAAAVDLLLQVVDALRAQVECVAEGRPVPDHPALVGRLRSAAPPGAGPVRPAAAQPSTGTAAAPLPAGPRTRVFVALRPDTTAPAARAFLVLRRLAALGDVLSSEPSAEELRAGKAVEGGIVVVLAGAHARESLDRALSRVPDVASVEVGETPAPAAAPLRAPDPEPAPAAADATVKVRVELLDQLLEVAGELLLSSSRLRERTRVLAERAPLVVDEAFEEESDRLRLLVRDLNNRVLVARQTPVAQVAERLPRAVRELARRLGKELQLHVEAMDVTLDRGLVEALADPLMHLVRNAADHAIEPPDERERAGKPRAGRLVLSARRERDRVVVQLRDDGRGFDIARLRAKAVLAGALTAEQAAALDDEQALRLSLLPGLSTRDRASDVSGRGVGMDAVLAAVEQVGGSVALASRPGEGSTVSLMLPATVSLVNLLLVGLGSEVFGLPMNRVLAALQPQAESELPGRVHPLGRLLGLPEEGAGAQRPVVVVDAEGQQTAVGVDRLIGQEEVVLRPLCMPLERIRGLAGTAILGSGRPIFVLDVPRLVA